MVGNPIISLSLLHFSICLPVKASSFTYFRIVSSFVAWISFYFILVFVSKWTQAPSPFGFDFLCHTRSCVYLNFSSCSFLWL